MGSQSNAILISYDSKTEQFTCLSTQQGIGPQLCRNLNEGKDCSASLRDLVLAMASQGPQAQFHLLSLGGRTWRVGIISSCADSVSVTLTDLSTEALIHSSQTDPLTGLMTIDAFCTAVEQRLQCEGEAAAQGVYAIVYLDLHRFKAVNELFGRATGDKLLQMIADVFHRCSDDAGLGCRLSSDHFAGFLRTENQAVERLLEELNSALNNFDIPFEITFHAGVYEISEEQLSAIAMIDRAAMALSSIKGSYNVRCAYYTAQMRKALLTEQEITGLMAAALEEKQFVLHYQPQYNHSTGMLVGAEALVRWNHPENGMISPGVFIPIFEKNGFITNLDLYVFQEVCSFLRRCMDHHWSLVPVSVNFSRYDIFLPNLVERLEEIRRHYDIPVKYLRVELTESVMVGGTDYVNDVIGKLHQCGYVVEMDDFGSGYSSLNVLKDIDLDVIKLDMQFLSRSSRSNKGGTILSSIVRMARWLNMPVIAEGVETVEQADFLRSIGCEYIQGYLYSRPLPEERYVSLISASKIGATVPHVHLIDTLNAFDFWDPKSQETLIFSNYVGAAAIVHLQQNKLELLRVNQKYLQELGMNLSEKELIQSDPLSVMEKKDQDVYLSMLYRAIETGEEQECETWWNISSSCCGDERFCIRSTVRLIGSSSNQYLFHCMIRNITAERLYYDSMADTERRFRMASEQVNIYFWEYTIATKEMRPCFRCMRDLGLPPVLTNYPESAIEGGVFPPEVADSYREFMRQIDQGAPSMEGIYPLTMDRIPFHVRYTTEFDEYGHPIKAYGSAALVVD